MNYTLWVIYNIYHILPLQMVLFLTASVQVWMSIYEQKCLYFTNKQENETIVISYNTVEPQLDQRHHKNKGEQGYRFTVMTPDGKKSEAYKINGTGEQNISAEQTGEYQLCFEMDIPSDDYEKKLREQRRMARRVDISIFTNSEL